MEQIVPLHDRIVVERLSAETVSPGGIFVPQTAQKQPWKGHVRAVGPGRVLGDGKTLPISVKIGDLVLLPQHGGTEIVVNGKPYVLIEEAYVLARVIGKASMDTASLQGGIPFGDTIDADGLR